MKTRTKASIGGILALDLALQQEYNPGVGWDDTLPKVLRRCLLLRSYQLLPGRKSSNGTCVSYCSWCRPVDQGIPAAWGWIRNPHERSKYRLNNGGISVKACAGRARLKAVREEVRKLSVLCCQSMILTVRYLCVLGAVSEEGPQ